MAIPATTGMMMSSVIAAKVITQSISFPSLVNWRMAVMVLCRIRADFAANHGIKSAMVKLKPQVTFRISLALRCAHGAFIAHHRSTRSIWP